MKRRPRSRQRGFTLIELMIALVVSSLLVGMILAIFIRMSIAYRGQQQVAEVQSKLAAARAQIEMDAKHAGLNMADGFKLASTGTTTLNSPVQVFNNTAGPDQIAFFYADTMIQAALITGTCNGSGCAGLDSTLGFQPGDLIVASQAGSRAAVVAGDAAIIMFQACVLKIETMGPTSFVYSTTAPWGAAGNPHCTFAMGAGNTMFYKLIAHAWRIDPARPADGVLQLSPSGGIVANDWQDQGYGFTDIQVATRFFEEGDTVDTLDPDLDPQRDWYSSAQQQTYTAAVTPGPFAATPIQMSISLVARTERDVEGIASASTPNLRVDTNPSYNPIGDRAAVLLPSAALDLAGNRIFRYTTFQVDLRNTGVGR